MIRINLYGAQSSSGSAAKPSLFGGLFAKAEVGIDEEQPNQQQALIKIVVIMLFPFGLFAYENMRIPELRNKLVQRQNLLSELQAYNARAAESVEEIKKIQEDKARLEEQIKAIEGLSAHRLRNVRSFEVIQNNIPEKSWLTKVSVTSKKMTLHGFVNSQQELSSFTQALTRSVFFVEVVLMNAQQVKEQGLSLIRFEIDLLLEKD